MLLFSIHHEIKQIMVWDTLFFLKLNMYDYYAMYIRLFYVNHPIWIYLIMDSDQFSFLKNLNNKFLAGTTTVLWLLGVDTPKKCSEVLGTFPNITSSTTDRKKSWLIFRIRVFFLSQCRIVVSQLYLLDFEFFLAVFLMIYSWYALGTRQYCGYPTYWICHHQNKHHTCCIITLALHL